VEAVGDGEDHRHRDGGNEQPVHVAPSWPM
jgi:hypothetical protein